MNSAEKKEKLAVLVGHNDFEIVWAEELASTNETSAALAMEGRENIVVADVQSRGSGRLGREFISDAGGLYESIAICIDDIFPEAETPEIGRTLHFPLVCALSAMHAITDVCSKYTGADIVPDIKWPNDLQIAGKKIGGILCKAVKTKSSWFIVCGVGINIFNELGDGLEDAGRLCEFSGLKEAAYGAEDDLIVEMAATLANNIIKNLRRGIKDAEELLDEVEEHCITIGKYVTVPEKDIRGIAIQIGDDGSLCIETKSGDYEIIRSGDVALYK